MFGQGRHSKAASAYGADGDMPEPFRDEGDTSRPTGNAARASVHDTPRLRNRTLAAIFVRHGDTTANKGEGEQELVRGQKDYPLNADGRKEATVAGRTIARHGGVSRVYSSSLSRGTSTAKAIASATGATHTVTQGLMPWDKGDAEGKPVETEDPKLRRHWNAHPSTPVPGGESPNAFKERSDSAARSIVSAGKASLRQLGKPVAAVSHSVDMRRLHHQFEGASEPDPLSGGPKPGEMMGVTVGGAVKKVKPGMWGSR